MRVLFYSVFSVFFLSALLQAEEAWEKVAVEGITAINRGEGKKLVEIGHSEYKEKFKTSMLKLYKSFPEKDCLSMCETLYGLKDLAELEKLSVDQFVEKTIVGNLQSARPELAAIMKSMKFSALSSVKQGDLYLVTIEAKFSAKGEEHTHHMVIYAKQEKGQWKYFGDSQTLK